MKGGLLPPLFMGEGTWDLSSPQERAIELARRLADQETPAEPVLTFPGGEGGFPEDPRLS